MSASRKTSIILPWTRNRPIQVISLKNQTLIADKCVEANSFLARLKGLIGRTELGIGEGMLFPRCNEIHMWFMRTPIDVLFLERTDVAAELRVVKIVTDVKPWRALPLYCRGASSTLELKSGTCVRTQIEQGDILCIV
jgi:uncharacterized membrane protein (UPF0127 family)